MTDRASDDLRRLTELLGDRASGSLSDADGPELERLLASVEGADAIASEYDQVEGGLVGAIHAGGGPLAPSLRAALIERGQTEVRRNRASAEDADPATIPIATPIEGAGRRAGVGPWGSWGARLGWLVAAAALALAAVAWWPAGPRDLAPTPAERRADLERRAPDAITIALDPATEAPGATAQGATLVADVVWSDAEQRGFLRVRGLRPNDPRVEQYQVWISDATRDDPSRVSGAVFDVTPSSVDPVTRDLIVELDPGVRIGRAIAFTVTIEPAGGSVISEGTRIVLRGDVG